MDRYILKVFVDNSFSEDIFKHKTRRLSSINEKPPFTLKKNMFCIPIKRFSIKIKSMIEKKEYPNTHELYYDELENCRYDESSRLHITEYNKESYRTVCYSARICVSDPDTYSDIKYITDDDICYLSSLFSSSVNVFLFERVKCMSACPLEFRNINPYMCLDEYEILSLLRDNFSSEYLKIPADELEKPCKKRLIVRYKNKKGMLYIPFYKSEKYEYIEKFKFLDATKELPKTYSNSVKWILISIKVINAESSHIIKLFIRVDKKRKKMPINSRAENLIECLNKHNCLELDTIRGDVYASVLCSKYNKKGVREVVGPEYPLDSIVLEIILLTNILKNKFPRDSIFGIDIAFFIFVCFPNPNDMMSSVDFIIETTRIENIIEEEEIIKKLYYKMKMKKKQIEEDQNNKRLKEPNYDINFKIINLTLT